ncbi:hypothetical protein [Ruminococcus sp.]|uniref:hypothetical protein n=1 Tax=Ruminococcus sp. TaxID=41978 RepID=UPI003FD6E487
MKILITTDCYKPTINGVVTSILNLETELRKRCQPWQRLPYSYDGFDGELNIKSS